MTNPIKCPYCNQDTKLVTGKVIYPHRPDLYDRHFYLCKPCNAYVGTHKKTSEPLGKPANLELRIARRKAHAALDPIWQESETIKRSDVYAALAKALNISRDDCHIGQFDIEMCQKVIEICNNGLKSA